MNEEVKKILESNGVFRDNRNIIAKEICQLFEPKGDVARIFNEDGTSGIATGANKPKFNNVLEADAHNWDTRELPKPDRLLTPEEIKFYHKTYEDESHEHWHYTPKAVAKAQRDLTASIKDAEWRCKLLDAGIPVMDASDVPSDLYTKAAVGAECQERAQREGQIIYDSGYIAGKVRGNSECQERVEGIKKEIEDNSEYDIIAKHSMRIIEEKWWMEFWKKEGVK